MKHKIPDTITGYELDEEDKYGVFDIIMPKSCTNYVHNPSMARGSITGYKVGVGCTIALTEEYQRRGLYSLAVTPTADVCKVYYDLGDDTTIDAGTKCHFSCDILGAAGEGYYIYVTDTSNVLKTEKRHFNTSGEWMRVHVGFSPLTNSGYHLYIEHADSASRNIFYLDGFQFEKRQFASTYCDGDEVGFVLGRNDYAWLGERCNSRSYRIAQSRSGGVLVNLKRLGFHVTGIIGLGMNPVEPVSLDMAGGGGLYQKTKDTQREFSIVGNIYGKSRAEVFNIKRKLSYLLSSKSWYPDQPLFIQYCKKDSNGFATSKEYLIKCVYLEGLEGVTDQNYNETINLRFKLYEPWITTHGNSAAVLKIKEAITDVNYVIRRSLYPQADTDIFRISEWEKLGTGPAGDGLTDSVWKFMEGNNGAYIYAFMSSGNIERWDGLTWTVLPSTYDSGTRSFCPEMAIDSNGRIWRIWAKDNTPNPYTYGLAYSTDYGDTWATEVDLTTLDADIEFATYVHTNIQINKIKRIEEDIHEHIIFGSKAESTSGCRVFSYNPYTKELSVVGTRPSNTTLPNAFWNIEDIQINNETGVYYLYIAHVSALTQPYSYVYTITDGGTWEKIATTYRTIGTYEWSSRLFLVASDGKFYMGGSNIVFLEYTNRFGDTVTIYPRHLAVWNGYDWSQVIPFDTAIDNVSNELETVKFLYQMRDGTLVVSGNFVSSIYGVYMGLCSFDGISLKPLYGIDIQDPIRHSYDLNPVLFEDSQSRIYIGFGEVTEATIIVDNTNNIIFNNGDAISYPVIEMTGPIGLTYIYEGTIDGGIIFDNLYLADGERAVLTTGQFGIMFYSDLRGNIISYVSKNSNFNYRLNPFYNYQMPYARISGHSGDGGANSSGDLYISNWDFVSNVTYSSTDNGIIYVTFAVSGANYTINLYKDSARTQLVAHVSTFTTNGAKELVEDNSSGVYGTIIIDALPVSTVQFPVYFGRIVLMWKENYTSLHEDDIPRYNQGNIADNVTLFIGEDNIL